MNDAQSTIVGLKHQECPGGGWNGMPAELEGKATVADCLADGSCGCIYGDAVRHIERLRALLKHADDVVIWEHTPARSGFQEEIEAALGIGTNEQHGDHK